MKQVSIYTDGACKGNPGPGGWAAILNYQGRSKTISGGEMQSTNQRMELTAALKALEHLKEPCAVTVYTDSAYLVNAFRQGWIGRWQKNGWKTKDGRPVANRELWEEMLNAMRPHRVSWEHIPGHSGHEFNEMADQLARAEIKKMLAK